MDKTSHTESIQNRKGYLTTNIYGHNFILGNVRIQIGNSLLFGSDYNSIKSSGSILSPGKIRWKISPYLGSETSSNPAGIFVLKNKGETNYYIGGDSFSLSSGLRINEKIVNSIAVGYLPKDGPLHFHYPVFLKQAIYIFRGKPQYNQKTLHNIFNCFPLIQK